MAKKFVVNAGRVILGEVEYHSGLLRDHTETVGGGLWHYDHETKTLLLYGSSTDFGSVSQSVLESAQWPRGDYEAIVYSMAPTLQEAQQSGITLNRTNA